LEALLSIFQIKTVRSAWVFLAGSSLLFLFGVYQAIRYSSEIYSFNAIYYSVWFLISGVYIGLASWALITTKGREYLAAQERIPFKRTMLWYLKFLIACYGMAFGSLILIGILSLPFFGYAGFDAIFSPNSRLYFLVAGLIWAPIVFWKLK